MVHEVGEIMRIDESLGATPTSSSGPQLLKHALHDTTDGQ
jgi:hypothetical protein